MAKTAVTWAVTVSSPASIGVSACLAAAAIIIGRGPPPAWASESEISGPSFIPAASAMTSARWRASAMAAARAWSSASVMSSREKLMPLISLAPEATSLSNTPPSAAMSRTRSVTMFCAA